MRNIGLLYEFGFGVKQDLTVALSWFQKAENDGNPDAHNDIDRVKKKIR